MTSSSKKSLLISRVEGLRQIPTIPAVLQPLLQYLELPTEQLDVQKITRMIAQDESLAAQCLQMANSPLFGKWQKIDSLKAAVVSLGIQRVSDIAMSCGVLNMVPKDLSGINLVAFWEHSLGCALVCRQFARKISYPDISKAYLAGLLHDVGIVVNLWVLANEFRAAFDFGREHAIPLHAAEQYVLGFDHCESGLLLAERWGLAPDLRETVSLHHATYESAEHASLIALVELADLLCRMGGLNYGYVERREINLLNKTGFGVLSKLYPQSRDLDWARLTFELESYIDEVRALVHAIYHQ